MPLKWIILCIIVLCVGSFQLNFIEIIIGDNPVVGYRAIAPAFDVALSTFRDLYPNLLWNSTRYRLAYPTSFTCVDASALIATLTGQIWEQVGNNTGLTVIISPGLC